MIVAYDLLICWLTMAGAKSPKHVAQFFHCFVSEYAQTLAHLQDSRPELFRPEKMCTPPLLPHEDVPGLATEYKAMIRATHPGMPSNEVNRLFKSMLPLLTRQMWQHGTKELQIFRALGNSWQEVCARIESYKCSSP